MGDLITTEIMFLKLTERDFPSFDQLKKKLLGKIVFSNWPYLIESKYELFYCFTEIFFLRVSFLLRKKNTKFLI